MLLIRRNIYIHAYEHIHAYQPGSKGVYTYIRIYTCICIYICIYMYIYIYICIYIYVYIYICTCIYIYIYIYVYVYICIHICIYTCIHVHTYIHVWINVYIYVSRKAVFERPLSSSSKRDSTHIDIYMYIFKDNLKFEAILLRISLPVGLKSRQTLCLTELCLEYSVAPTQRGLSLFGTSLFRRSLFGTQCWSTQRWLDFSTNIQGHPQICVASNLRMSLNVGTERWFIFEKRSILKTAFP